MIYTSYFGKLKKLPHNYEPICIAKWPPKWFKGKQFSQLAPSKELLNWWNGSDKDKDCEITYELQFRKQTLSKLDPIEIEKAIHNLAGDKIPVLVCYEKSYDFCHRHLVRNWLNKNGIKCEEFNE